MKRFVILFSLLIILGSGCDRIRKSLGMPTSEELSQKSELIAKKEAREKAVQDSLKAQKDSLLRAQQAVQSEQKSAPVQLSDNAIDSKYLIVVGTFLVQKNVERCIAKYANVMDTPFIIKRWDDMYMVAVGRADSFEDAKSKLAIVQKEAPEAWIYRKR